MALRRSAMSAAFSKEYPPQRPAIELATDDTPPAAGVAAGIAGWARATAAPPVPATPDPYAHAPVPLLPLAGRIVAIADVFDATTSDRPYKQPWSVDRAVAFMQGIAGSRLDPRLIEVFVRELPKMLEIKDRFEDDPIPHRQRAGGMPHPQSLRLA